MQLNAVFPAVPHSATAAFASVRQTIKLAKNYLKNQPQKPTFDPLGQSQVAGKIHPKFTQSCPVCVSLVS